MMKEKYSSLFMKNEKVFEYCTFFPSVKCGWTLIVCLEADYTCEKYNVLIGNTWFSDDAYFWTSQIFESDVLNFCAILIKKPIIKVKTLYQLSSLFCEMILHIKTCS